MKTKFLHSIIMLTKIAKKESYGAKKKKKTLKIWNVDVDNIAILKLIETKNNFNYFIGYLNEVDMLKHLKKKIINSCLWV